MAELSYGWQKKLYAAVADDGTVVVPTPGLDPANADIAAAVVVYDNKELALTTDYTLSWASGYQSVTITNKWGASWEQGKNLYVAVPLKHPITNDIVGELLQHEAAIGSETVVEKTDDATLELSHAGKTIEMNKGSANTLTIPANATVAFPIGTRIRVRQTGAGQTTIAGADGVTVNKAAATLKVIARWGEVILTKRAANVWNANGDLAAS